MKENGRVCALHNHTQKKNHDKEGILPIKISLATRRSHFPMRDHLFSREAERLVEIEESLAYPAGFPSLHKLDVYHL